jgi:hypothetical protein
MAIVLRDNSGGQNSNWGLNLFTQMMGGMAKNQMSQPGGDFEADAKLLAAAHPDQLTDVLPLLTSERGKRIAMDAMIKQGVPGGSGSQFGAVGDALAQGSGQQFGDPGQAPRPEQPLPDGTTGPGWKQTVSPFIQMIMKSVLGSGMR